MKTISNTRYQIAVELLEAEFSSQYKKFESRIEFFSMGTSSDVIEMGVNWSACGTMDPEETIEFAEALAFAAKLARDFIFNGCVRGWGMKDDEFIEKVTNIENAYREAMKAARYEDDKEEAEKARIQSLLTIV